jgi:HTH-type transcriptional regulator, sugar sensing transcriptional regulator
MIFETKFLNKLKAFNINSYEAKIWAALLSRGVSTAGELSDIANVPRSRAYDVLESLERKGFIVMRVGKPIKYIAVSPEEVMERVKSNYSKEADEKISAINELKNDLLLNELNMLYNHGIELIEPCDISGALKDRNSYYTNLNMLIKEAEKSIIIMTTSEGLVRKADALKKSLTKANKKGVEIKIAAPLNEKTKEAEEKLSEIAKIKNITNINSRFLIVDGKKTIFSLLDDKQISADYDSAIWVNTDFFAQSIQSMFEHVWENDETKEIELKNKC